MGRAPCCEKVGLKKGRWTAEEDRLLVDYIKANGEGAWRSLPKNAGLLRCGKSCRLRWVNYLREDLKRGNITPEEEESIIKLRAELGSRWSVIATHLPGRTDNEIKNYWNAHLSKKAGAHAAVPEDGAGEPAAEADDDGGEVCNEDAGSIVVDSEEEGTKDCATSSVTPKRKSKTKVKASKRAKGAGESCEEEGEGEGHKGREEENCDAVGCCAKKKRGRGDKGGCCKDSSTDGGRKKEKRGAASVVENEQANKGVVKNESRKKRKKEKQGASIVEEEAVNKEPTKKKKKVLKQPTEKPARAETTAACVQEPVHADDTITTDPTAHPVKTDLEIDASGCGGGVVTELAGMLCGVEEEKGSLTQVEDGLNSANVGPVLAALANAVDDCATGLDLLEVIDTDGSLLDLPIDACLDPHGGMLLDYFDDTNGSDGACSWSVGANVAEEVDNTAGEWSVSATVTADAAPLASEDINNASGGTTTSSYVNFTGLCDGSPAPAGKAADHGIGSLPWEAEDDMWRLLYEFLGQVDGAQVRDHQPVPQAATQLLHQPEMIPGFVSNVSICGDDLLADGSFDNPWLRKNLLQDESYNDRVEIHYSAQFA